MEMVAALLIAGAVLLLLETILPGLIAGIVGMCCLIAGIVVAYNDFGTKTGHTVLMGVLTGLIIASCLWLKYFPNSRLIRPLVSKSTVGDVGAEKPELLDQTGTAYTTLRPSGMATINGKRVDVVTEGGMIERGTLIKVVQIEGLRVVVRAIN